MNFLPFSYNWVVQRNLNKANVKTVLDLGCGTGTTGIRFNQNNQYLLTGVDIFAPYLEECLRTGKYAKVKSGDFKKKLKFKSKGFDAVVCLETIEHLSKKDGLKLIGEAERTAKKVVIFTCPMGKAIQESYDENKYQKHLSSWFPGEFTKRGYKVNGIGLKSVYGKHTHVNHTIKPYTAPLYFLSFLANPITNIFPNISCQMVAIKLL